MPKIESKCEKCERDFFSWPCERAKYCSRVCYHSASETRESNEKRSLAVRRWVASDVGRAYYNERDYFGEGNPNWTGGRIRGQCGYVYAYLPDHPFSRKGYVPEHRLVVENQRGITLNPWIIVHHRNGIKDDNRIENLETMMQKDHARKHMMEIVNTRTRDSLGRLT